MRIAPIFSIFHLYYHFQPAPLVTESPKEMGSFIQRLFITTRFSRHWIVAQSHSFNLCCWGCFLTAKFQYNCLYAAGFPPVIYHRRSLCNATLRNGTGPSVVNYRTVILGGRVCSGFINPNFNILDFEGGLGLGRV